MTSQCWGLETLRPQKVYVWCDILEGRIIFIKNEAVNHVTLNGERYETITNNFFGSQVENADVDDLWFQLRGATFHTYDETINILKENDG